MNTHGGLTFIGLSIHVNNTMSYNGRHQCFIQLNRYLKMSVIGSLDSKHNIWSLTNTQLTVEGIYIIFYLRYVLAPISRTVSALMST